jgi:hypothetical protein
MDLECCHAQVFGHDDDPQTLSCQVAQHCWDPVRLAIVEYAPRFERLTMAEEGKT